MAFSPFEIFTGSAADKAAADQRAAIEASRARVAAQGKQTLTGGLEQLQQGLIGATAAIQGAVPQARNDIISSTGPALNSLYGGQVQGINALQAGQTGGLSTLQQGVNAATGAYAPLSGLGAQFAGAYTPTAQMYSNALGLRGPAGTAAATQAFQAGPGYQFALNQGLESIARNANVAGMAAGGNALQEAQRYGQGLANQEYERWRQALAQRETQAGGLAAGAYGNVGQGVSQAALTGGTGGANIYTGTAGREADLYGRTGAGGADIYGTAGRTLADIALKGGLAESSLFQGSGQAGANLYGNVFGTQTGFEGQALQPYLNTYQQEAAAAAGGSKNLWNLGMQAATLGAGGFGSLVGGGGLAGALTGGQAGAGTTALGGLVSSPYYGPPNPNAGYRTFV